MTSDERIRAHVSLGYTDHEAACLCLAPPESWNFERHQCLGFFDEILFLIVVLLLPKMTL
jgi:hypothetical protein